MVQKTIELGLIRDFANPISKSEVGTILLQAAFQDGGQIDVDTLGFTNLG